MEIQQNNPITTEGQKPTLTQGNIRAKVDSPIPNGWKIATVILAILLIVAIGYIAILLQDLGRQVASTQQDSKEIQSQVTPTPLVDKIENWETFKNTKYGYQFDHPSDYTVVQNGINSDQPELSGGVVALNYNAKDFPDEPRLTVSIDLTAGTLEQKAKAFFDKWGTYEGDTAMPGAENNQVVSSLTQTTFANNDAYSFTITGSYYSDGSAEGISNNIQRKYIWVQNANNIFIIRADNLLPTNQMVSTFKFMDSIDEQ